MQDAGLLKFVTLSGGPNSILLSETVLNRHFYLAFASAALASVDPDDDLKVWGYAKHIITHGRRHHVADKGKGHHPDEQGDGEDSDHGEN